MMTDIIGKRVKIVGKDHPHTGEHGTVLDIQTTFWGATGLRINLDNGGSCFIFHHNQYVMEDKHD